MTTFLSGAFAGLLVGGFIGTMVMAILNYARSTDEEYGIDTGTDPYPGDVKRRIHSDLI